MTRGITQVLLGPRCHGVVHFGLALHSALNLHVEDASLIHVTDLAALPCGVGGEGTTVHVQFTDRLFGSSADAAAWSFTALACAVRTTGAALTATLHDLPQRSDGVHLGSRIRAYRTVASLCDAIVVSSDHERQLLRENNIRCGQTRVIPLPLERVDRGAPPALSAPTTLGIFGFIYPGKGHHDVLAAAQELPADIEIHAIGAASTGHDDLVARLRRAAVHQRRTFRVTGHIPEDALVRTLRAVTVPVAAHRHISASGSLNTWLSAGRRPLAPINRYTLEAARRNPGCLLLFQDTTDALRTAIRRALRNPASTWLPTDAALLPSPSQAAGAYAEVMMAAQR